MNKLNLIWTFQIKENKLLYQLLEASQKTAEVQNSVTHSEGATIKAKSHYFSTLEKQHIFAKSGLFSLLFLVHVPPT
jgi:hypothetical protein